MKPIICAIPQIRIRFPGDRMAVEAMLGTFGLNDIMVSLSVPAAKKLMEEIKRALRTKEWK